MGLWVMAGSHVSQQLTDGFVADWFVAGFPNGRSLARRLVDVELWHPVEGGWMFHEWDLMNPTRTQVESDRERHRKRMQEWRDAQGS